jgi:hypothetical protein
MRWPALACALALTLAPSATEASVSIPVLFDALLRDSRAVVVATARDASSAWENGRIRTRTAVHVDELVAGHLPSGVSSDVRVRTNGGVVGDLGQRVEGEAALAPGDASLLFLQCDADGCDVTARAQGQFRIVRDALRGTYLAGARDVGGLVVPPQGQLAASLLDGLALEAAKRAIVTGWKRLHAEANR